MSNPDFSLNRAQLDDLKEQLKQLITPYENGSTKHLAWIEKILFQHYSETQRKYHNLHHIYSLLQLAQQYQKQINHCDSLLFAIWFHDIIYDPKQPDNEFQSAQIAMQALKRLNTNASMQARVKSMILMTEEHRSQGQSTDYQLFSDFDLMILGAPTKIYTAYSQAIRQEYHWVPESRYRQARSQILLQFLQRRNIYLTHTIQTEYEQQARKNLAQELKSLQKMA